MMGMRSVRKVEGFFGVDLDIRCLNINFEEQCSCKCELVKKARVGYKDFQLFANGVLEGLEN
ncbi:hypothetical protein PU02_0666 [Bartonella ancashensis]|uniref:Uncharacterized protein n=1 Tax=Bartonella ancashensis TaxID=1318743 RepID=A0A0M4LIE6_9HYPH|nr:hypothetical protein PU02_0666 [Bartonella ancashensis]